MEGRDKADAQDVTEDYLQVALAFALLQGGSAFTQPKEVADLNDNAFSIEASAHVGQMVETRNVTHGFFDLKLNKLFAKMAILLKSVDTNEVWHLKGSHIFTWIPPNR